VFGKLARRMVNKAGGPIRQAGQQGRWADKADGQGQLMCPL